MNALNISDWKKSFRTLFNLAVDQYRAEKRGADTFFTPAQVAELAAFGYRPQELYDFAEDRVKYGEPDLETALAIAEVRHDYFLQVQNSQMTTKRIDMATLPPKDAAAEGIVWLPRIIEKAKAKLRGEMPDDLMYGCGGDRKFFKTNNVDPVKFLHAVWMADGDDAFVIEFVQKCAGNS